MGPINEFDARKPFWWAPPAGLLKGSPHQAPTLTFGMRCWTCGGNLICGGRIRRGTRGGDRGSRGSGNGPPSDHGWTLIGDVGQSYFRLRELDEQIEIAKRNLAIRQDSLNLISSREQAGLANNLDIKRAEVLVAESAAEIPDLERLRAQELSSTAGPHRVHTQ